MAEPCGSNSILKQLHLYFGFIQESWLVMFWIVLLLDVQQADHMINIV